MQRWLSSFVAVLMLVSAQPVLAAQPEQGVVKDFVNPTPPRCNNPEGIAASPNGLIYAAGLSGNVCVYTLSGELTRVIPVVAGHALLGELFVAGDGLYVADNNAGFSGGRLIRVDPGSGAVTQLATGFRAINAITQDHHGTLYVSDSFANPATQEGEIFTVSPSGGGKALWAHSPLLAPHGFPPFGAHLSLHLDLGVEHGDLCACCVLGIKRGAPFGIAVLGNVNAGGYERRARPVPPKGIPRVGHDAYAQLA